MSASTSCTDVDLKRTSTVVNGHTHTVCVGADQLAIPSAGGMTFATSESQGHSHMITLTQEQLENIASGREVTVVTTTVQLHQHEFMLVQTATPQAADISGR
jgi:hypothetical protein